MKAKLTHFADGCAVTVAIPHAILDGQRYVELMRDLGRAYRGVAVPDRCHDRSHLWPDQLAKSFPFLGEEVANLPRKVSPFPNGTELPVFESDTAHIRMLHFPEASVPAYESSRFLFASS